MMNISNKNHRYRLPLWQLKKMRNIIDDRWEEVWGVVVARDRSLRDLHQYPLRNLHQYLESSKCN